MTIGETGNLIGIFSGVVGAMYAARGIISLNPNEILRSYSSYNDIVHSREEMTAIVKLRIEARMGILYVILSSIIQVSALSKSSWKDYELTYEYISLIIIIVTITVYFLHLLSKKYVNLNVNQVNKLYVKYKIDSIPERINGASMLDYDFIVKLAENYFMKQKADQSIIEFLNEVSAFVGSDKRF